MFQLARALVRSLGVTALLTAVACSPGGRDRRTDTLVFTGLAGEPDSLNPLLSGTSDLYTLSHLYLSDLVESDDRGQLIAEIADRVPTTSNGGISRDGLTITYHLRVGVRWQDGAALDARDIAFSYRAVMNPATNVAYRVGYDVVASIATPDAHTVVVRLKHPFSPFVAYFCGPQGFGILPAHVLAKYPNLNRVPFDELPIGSGPYRVVSWRRGDEIVFAANPSFWRGAPHIAKLVYRIIPDSNTRMQALQTGEVDAYFDSDPQLLPQLREIANVRIAQTPVNDFHVVRFNLRDPTIGDAHVRRAIALAIDRTKVATVATRGSGLVTDGDQPRNGWAYDASAPAYAYDPATARRELDAGGWLASANRKRSKNGRPLVLTLAISPQAVNGSGIIATLLQRYLADVGMTVEIKSYSPGLMYGPPASGGILTNGRFQLAYDAWWILGPDPDDSWQFACDQRPPAGENDSNWCDARYDAAIHDALYSNDRARRKRDYAIVARGLHDDLPMLPLYQVEMPNAYRNTLHGFAPSPFGSEFWNAYAWTIR